MSRSIAMRIAIARTGYQIVRLDGSAGPEKRRRHTSAQLVLKNVSPGGSNSSVSSLHRSSNLRLAPESPALYAWPAVVRSCKRPIAVSVAMVEAVPLESRETFTLVTTQG
jgi:hypothetical protein